MRGQNHCHCCKFEVWLRCRRDKSLFVLCRSAAQKNLESLLVAALDEHRCPELRALTELKSSQYSQQPILSRCQLGIHFGFRFEEKNVRVLGGIKHLAQALSNESTSSKDLAFALAVARCKVLGEPTPQKIKRPTET